MIPRKIWKLSVAICLTLSLLIGCDDASKPTDNHDEQPHAEPDAGPGAQGDVLYPGEEWPVADPATANMDPKMLEKAIETAAANDSHCLLVTRGGKIITEWYENDWDEDTEGNLYSVTKSLAGLVVGLAVQQGRLDIDDPAHEYIPHWADDDRRNITIRHLLSMTSGLSWSLIGDFVELSNQSDMTQYAVDLSLDNEPDSYWQYSNAAVQTLDAILSSVLEENVGTWAKTHLFEPIGATASFSQDSEGNTMLFSEARASCRDLARIGYLVLRDGKWGDNSLIDPAFLESATSPSSDLNEAYGYLWWLNTDGHWVTTPSTETEREEGDGSMWPTAPDHIIVAKGLQAQLIVIDKVNDLVFSRIGGDPNPVSAVISGKDWTMDEFTNELFANIYGALEQGVN